MSPARSLEGMLSSRTSLSLVKHSSLPVCSPHFFSSFVPVPRLAASLLGGGSVTWIQRPQACFGKRCAGSSKYVYNLFLWI